jgi:mannose-1-phosphate guanylyltransferase/mannose-6-phosphate isomerase-like protein (cupin superfamily)
MLHTVILAGGSGTRLWPLSRANYPKQFLKLLGEHTLLQQTVLRVSDLVSPECTWVVTGAEQEPLVRNQFAALSRMDNAHIFGEPLPRNTAAAIGLAAIHIRRIDPDAVMIVLPADHWITRPQVFVSLLRSAAEAALDGMLVTLGIVPDHPATGYGYIQRGERLQEDVRRGEEIEIYKVNRFMEKPQLQDAQRYIGSGVYYWNAGIFLWRADVILDEIAAHLPDLAHGLEELAQRLDSADAWEILPDPLLRKGENRKASASQLVANTLTAVYQRFNTISIDYGVLEKSARLVVVPADIGWSDLGDWGAIHHLSQRDDQGNVLSPNVIAIDSENSFVHGAQRTTALIGLKNTVVVDADDALLICPVDRAQEVREVVQQLQGQTADLAKFGRMVQRPWGTFTVLEEGARFKVKRLKVYPGAALSLQLHKHRSEHWVVVAGVASVRLGDKEIRLQENQSTYIAAGTKHRLANLESEPLEVIEVQTGSYLGEDDIVRFEDLYNRVGAVGVNGEGS